MDHSGTIVIAHSGPRIGAEGSVTLVLMNTHPVPSIALCVPKPFKFVIFLAARGPVWRAHTSAAVTAASAAVQAASARPVAAPAAASPALEYLSHVLWTLVPFVQLNIMLRWFGGLFSNLRCIPKKHKIKTKFRNAVNHRLLCVFQSVRLNWTPYPTFTNPLLGNKYHYLVTSSSQIIILPSQTSVRCVSHVSQGTVSTNCSGLINRANCLPGPRELFKRETACLVDGATEGTGGFFSQSDTAFRSTQSGRRYLMVSMRPTKKKTRRLWTNVHIYHYFVTKYTFA